MSHVEESVALTLDQKRSWSRGCCARKRDLTGTNRASSIA